MHPCLCHCWCSNWSCANGWGCLMLFGLHPLTTPQSQPQARQRIEILRDESHPDSHLFFFFVRLLVESDQMREWDLTILCPGKWWVEGSLMDLQGNDKKTDRWYPNLKISHHGIMEYVSYQMIWYHILSLHHTKSYTVHILPNNLYHPWVVYLPTFAWIFFMVNIGKNIPVPWMLARGIYIPNLPSSQPWHLPQSSWLRWVKPIVTSCATNRRTNRPLKIPMVRLEDDVFPIEIVPLKKGDIRSFFRGVYCLLMLMLFEQFFTFLLKFAWCCGDVWMESIILNAAINKSNVIFLSSIGVFVYVHVW